MPPKTKIFVGKLPPTCKDFELRKLFERYGEVTECSILGNYAFVHMKTEDQAATAIRNLNNWDMNGFKISVEVREILWYRHFVFDQYIKELGKFKTFMFVSLIFVSFVLH